MLVCYNFLSLPAWGLAEDGDMTFTLLSQHLAQCLILSSCSLHICLKKEIAPIPGPSQKCTFKSREGWCIIILTLNKFKILIKIENMSRVGHQNVNQWNPGQHWKGTSCIESCGREDRNGKRKLTTWTLKSRTGGGKIMGRGRWLRTRSVNGRGLPGGFSLLWG